MENVEELFKALGAFGIGILLAVSVAGLFWKLDDAIAEEPRQALSRFLQRLSVEPPYPNLPEIVAGAFVRVFGKKHLSWRCFFMSCLFSILAVGVLTLVYSQTEFHRLQSVYRLVSWSGFAVLAFSVNLIPDYISLMETRVVVRFMERTQGFPALLGYLGLDVLLTLLIFVGVGGLLYMLLFPVIGVITSGEMRTIDWSFDRLGIFWDTVFGMDAVTFSGLDGAVGIFLYSTFVTSVWVWLTALGWGAIRLVAKAPPLLRAMQYMLPIEERPMRSIGEVAAVIVCLGYWGISTAAWLTSTPEAQATLGN